MATGASTEKAIITLSTDSCLHIRGWRDNSSMWRLSCMALLLLVSCYRLMCPFKLPHWNRKTSWHPGMWWNKVESLGVLIGAQSLWMRLVLGERAAYENTAKRLGVALGHPTYCCPWSQIFQPLEQWEINFCFYKPPRLRYSVVAVWAELKVIFKIFYYFLRL